MREQLGLTPLNVETEQDNRVAEEARARQEKKETDEMREELAKRKKARLEKSNSGESLGDQLTKSVAGGSAADWTSRSRQLEEEKEKQKQQAKEQKKKK